jgi:hypothetical protein
MDRAAPDHPIDSVRVVVDDVPELDEAVRQAARRASALDCVLELVESPTGGDDHAARARVIRCMDEALEVARRTAPGVPVRVGAPIELPGHAPRPAP